MTTYRCTECGRTTNDYHDWLAHNAEEWRAYDQRESRKEARRLAKKQRETGRVA